MIMIVDCCSVRFDWEGRSNSYVFFECYREVMSYGMSSVWQVCLPRFFMSPSFHFSS